jgi:hypothetical protein
MHENLRKQKVIQSVIIFYRPDRQDLQDQSLKSHPSDPVHPVQTDFCSGFDSGRLLPEHDGSADKKYIKMLITVLRFSPQRTQR